MKKPAELQSRGGRSDRGAAPELIKNLSESESRAASVQLENEHEPERGHSPEKLHTLTELNESSGSGHG